ncbi:GspE/PulE family protein [Actinoplanes flavus]|uniref:Flp pilus assembly complex ATPase component TadA n=1 Tax=Actinoplanes flavus TaxID=2820290 RepID=A0ABS3ULK7_9ACTN|nr:ATPase, T2SS/T4P/T4SS family [Actinoplanes flavus]MBO3739649.1 Flp pilus assembly complex ATPase component TadA [Actinoplanes flavus]
MDQTFRPLLDALKQIGVDPAAVDRAAAEAQRSGRSVRAVLINDQVVTEEQLTEAAAAAFGIKTLDLVGFTPEPAALKRIPLPVVLRHRVLGLAINGNELVVGVTDPADVVALDDVRASTGMTIRPVVVARSEVRRIIERLQREGADLADLADEGQDDQAGMAAQATSTDDAPIVRYVNSLIEQAVMNRASDLHLEPTEDDMRVRYRIDGVLHEVDLVPRGVMSALISRIKIMSGVDITEKRIPQNGRITALIRDRTVDLRTATLPTVWGEKIVLRVLDTGGGIDLDLAKLGFTQHNLQRFSASFSKPHGMVLVTGPTGSGKSTTLYATLGKISRPEINVITVEDPVEYRLRGINQVQVNAKAGLTFAAVLPAILRTDPDVVLIGEIRDGATAQIAVEAALTGHLLLSTLHTNDAPGAVTRLTEMGIEPFLVGSSLDCVLAQRLARRICDWCKEPYAPTEEEIVGAHWPLADLAFPEVLYRPVGCRNCANTGYKGRIAVHEVMPVSPEIESLCIRRAAAGEIREVALAQGMYDLRADGLAKAAGGLTSIREVSRVAV